MACPAPIKCKKAAALKKRISDLKKELLETIKLAEDLKTEKKIKSDEHYLFLRVIGDEHAAEAIESYFRQQIIGFLKKYTQPWKNAKKNLGEK